MSLSSRVDALASRIAEEIKDLRGTDRGPIAWTPAFTNLTVNNGTLIGGYSVSHGMCLYWWKLTLGSSSAIGGAISLALPVATSQPVSEGVIGIIGYRDASTGGSAGRLQGFALGGATITPYANGTVVTGSAPWAWAAGDIMASTGQYPL